jgi:uncharacterized ubiquitin-like protein YukD
MIIVTVSFRTDTTDKAYDLEIPGNVPASVLRHQIAAAIREYSGHTVKGTGLFVRRLNRCIGPGETPDEAGIWNGDILEIK